MGDGGRPAGDMILDVRPRPAESPSVLVPKSNGLKEGSSNTGDFEDKETIEVGLAGVTVSASGGGCIERVETVFRGEGGGVGF